MQPLRNNKQKLRTFPCHLIFSQEFPGYFAINAKNCGLQAMILRKQLYDSRY